MSPPLRKSLAVPGICDPVCLKKFKTLLSQCFNVHVEDDIPDHMAFKARLRRTGLPRELHIEVFVNENMGIQASPEVQSFFQNICLEIENILKEAVDILSRQDTVRVSRAERIMEYMRDISVDNEIERMVIVTLCDIILDLLVTEKLSHFTHRRQYLENESVGAKLEMLKNEFKISVYKPKAIRDIRNLRNKVAHGGASTAREEAVFAQNTTIDIFEHF